TSSPAAAWATSPAGAVGSAMTTSERTARVRHHRTGRRLPATATGAGHPDEPISGVDVAGGPVGAESGNVTAGRPGDGPEDIGDARVAGALAFMRRRLTGAYEVDEFGFDEELAEGVFHPVLHRLYKDWFRVEVSGAKHLPLDSAALVVGNHSGTIALDALMLTHAVYDEPTVRRHLRLLGADLVFRLPFLSELARKGGATLAC